MKVRTGRPLWRAMPLLIAATLAACAQPGSPGLIQQDPSAPIQTGQLLGGATKQITQDVHPDDGFLPHSELLAAGGPGKAALVYLNPKVNMAAYRQVLLDPVVVRAGPNSQLHNVPADQQQALANVLYADLFNSLNGPCRMARMPAPNTMRMRFALVDATEPNMAINTIATFAPYWSTGYSVSSLLFNKGVGYFSGTATGEGFATDSVSGTLLWEAADKRGGTTALVADTLDSWRDVHHVFEAWGVQLRTRLQELGVCQV